MFIAGISKSDGLPAAVVIVVPVVVIIMIIIIVILVIRWFKRYVRRISSVLMQIPSFTCMHACMHAWRHCLNISYSFFFHLVAKQANSEPVNAYLAEVSFIYMPVSFIYMYIFGIAL